MSATEPLKRPAQNRDTVVLLPGLDGTAMLFYRQAPLLAQHFDVVTCPLPDDPLATMKSLVEMLRPILAKTHGRTILLGESFGGALAMSIALEAPEQVDGLVIVNSFPWLTNRIGLRLAPLGLRVLPVAAMPMLRRLTGSRLHSAHTNDEDLLEFRERARHIGADGYRRRLEILRSYDLRQRLGEISQPTLFLAADQDRLVPSVHWAHVMADQVPNAEMRVLEGYGHICLITHDLDLADIVVPWWHARTGQRTK
jgi:pimeloyl-ACP methyl ester carboxylesterase